MFGRTYKVSFSSDQKGHIESLSVQLEPAVKAIEFVRSADEEMTSKEFLEEFIGQYLLGERTITISLKGDKFLVMSIPGQPEYELMPYLGTEFKLKNRPNVSVEFVSDESGSIIKAKITQPEGVFIAERKR